MRFISSPIPNESGIIGQIDASVIPRFTEPNTFARLPQGDQVDHVDIAIMGVPFDAGVSYRPGTRFGPSYIRQCSKLIRPYNPALDLHPFAQVQVADFGDIAVNPFNIPEAISMIERAALKIIDNGTKLLTLGGDHTIALPLLRAFYAVYRKPITVVHFDAHLDTWDTYFGAAFTHGTPFRRASEEGLIDMERSVHVGIRGPLYSKKDLEDDQILGFNIIRTDDVEITGLTAIIDRLLKRINGGLVYISVDIDVLDPAYAPGTGTPEAGGLTSRELLIILRALCGQKIIGADIVEVSPPYDHGEITGIAAAHVAYDLLSIMGFSRSLE